MKLGLAVQVAHNSGASLVGALYFDKKLKRLVACASRSDGYVFYAFEVEDGPIMIKAGCRWFTQAEFRAHVLTYGKSVHGIAKLKETSRILDFIDGRPEDLGIAAKPKRVRTKKAAS